MPSDVSRNLGGKTEIGCFWMVTVEERMPLCREITGSLRKQLTEAFSWCKGPVLTGLTQETHQGETNQPKETGREESTSTQHHKDNSMTKYAMKLFRFRKTSIQAFINLN